VEFAEREAALEAVARRGLAAAVAGRAVLPARARADRDREGGARAHRDGSGDAPDETRLPRAARGRRRLGRSPGEEVLLRWEGEWERSPARLIEYARY
jgi:hypothetical protein